ncbi:hypothetical protein CCUS01_04551 [Colletotrichum cuscutae]|uniref:HNH nuclease domain-containing protein n=1 Tax=Colletotrichum cuscutae TaxID=1209917 RepID=A0AAI9Y7H6_9PEZI|nr:hypothetical protein CCUS01_04551 [Colletotrichum cuscutae]
MIQLGDYNDLGEDIIPADIEEPELSRLKGEGIDVPTARLGGLDLNYKICQIEEDLSALREASGEIDSDAAAQEQEVPYYRASQRGEPLGGGPCARTIAQGVETCYGRFDRYQTKSLGISNWFRDKALLYYGGQSCRYQAAEISRTDTEMENFLAESYEHCWCHATGSWMHLEETPDDEHAQPLPQRNAAANIVPYFSSVPHEILGHLFRERTGELSGPANSLLLSTLIQYWFNHYKLVIVPVDPEEKPLKRWKIDILDKGIEDDPLHDVTPTPGGDRPRIARGL